MGEEIKRLEELKENTSDFGEQMEIADKIHNIKMKMNGTRPSDSFIECVGLVKSQESVQQPSKNF